MSLDSLPDTLSRRRRRTSEAADPLRYDDIPEHLRMQILYLLEDAIEASNTDDRNGVFRNLSSFFRRELGVDQLSGNNHPEAEFRQWFIHHRNVENVVDAIERIGRVIEFLAERARLQRQRDATREFLSVLNGRLLEAGVGYQFENFQLIQADSRYLHAETVVPALGLLSDPKFASANHEFLDAHRAFREGDYVSALVEACKSLESTLKVIAAEKRWTVDQNAPLRTLIRAAIENELIPPFLEQEMAGLRSILENGVGTVRNQAGGHGAGATPRNVPRHLAAFQLHQTAATIVLLVEAAMP